MFPHEIRPLDESTNSTLLKDFRGERSGFVSVGDDKWILPAAYANQAAAYYSCNVRNDDVWVVTFPRSGTTICQELVWLVNNNFDYETSARLSLHHRFPFLEINTLVHDDLAQEMFDLNDDPEVIQLVRDVKTPGERFIDGLNSPRHIKTHLPFQLLPPKLLDTCKAVYVARNPKDAVVSYYHHNRLVRLHDFKNDFNTYWNYFKRDLLVFSPYWSHVNDGWSRRHNPNLLFMWYEDMIKDVHSAIKKVAHFLEKSVTEEQVNKLADHLHIDNFRKNVLMLTNSPLKGFANPKEQDFIRKGQIGGNKEFDEKLSAEADEWIDWHLKKTGISPFPHV